MNNNSSISGTDPSRSHVASGDASELQFGNAQPPTYARSSTSGAVVAEPSDAPQTPIPHPNQPLPWTRPAIGETPLAAATLPLARRTAAGLQLGGLPVPPTVQQTMQRLQNDAVLTMLTNQRTLMRDPDVHF